MTLEADLLRRFLMAYPFQPATAFWRAFETAHLVRYGLPDGRGLDIGCGDGLLTRIVLEFSGPRELVGVDPDPAETDLARKSGVYSHVHTAGAERVPEADSSFDWALSNSVLEHVDDIGGVLEEAGRLLRPEGLLLITVPGPDFHRCLSGPWLPRKRAAYLEAVDRRLHHLRYWGPDEWRIALAPACEVSSVTGYLTASQIRRWELVSRMTAGVLVAATAGRRRPIEIQRALGMRRAGRSMSARTAATLASVLTAGVPEEGGPPHGCILVIARRRSQGDTFDPIQ